MSEFYISHPSAIALLKKCKETLKDVRADDSDVIQDIDRYLVWKDPKEELPEIPEGAEWVDVWVLPYHSSLYKLRKTFFDKEEIKEYVSGCESWVYAFSDDNEPELP